MQTCHTTHAQLMNGELIQYLQVNKFIAESWPVAVEWYLTSLEYKSRGIPDYGKETYEIQYTSFPLDRAYQFWPLGSSRDYSSVFIDLVDGFNQNGVYFNRKGTGIINDQVTGFTLSQIESDFLKHVYGQSTLANELKNHKPIGVTDAQIDLLLNSF